MPGPITQEYILRGTAQFDDIQQKVNQTQNFLNGLKLPTNLKASFTQTFSQLQGSIQKASNLMQQGFTTKGNLSAFNKEINNITLGFDKLNRDMSKISDAKLKETLKTTQEYQQALSKIKLEKSSATDIQGEGLKAYNQSLVEVYKNIKEISQFKGFNSFKDAFESGNFEGAKEALGVIEQHLSKFRSADSIQKMTTYVGQLRSALEGAEKATAEETQRLKDLENAEQTLDAQGVQQLRDKIESLQREINILKSNTRGASDSINEMGKKSVQASTDIEQFKSRLTFFFGLNNGIQLVRRAFTKLIQTMKELDEVMTQTAVVTDYTVGDMWNQLPEITARANELGVAIKGVYEADMLFYQQGLKTNQVLELSNESMKMARIAGLDAKTATDRMTNALRGFNMELDKTNAQRINDVYNALAARTASNVQEISSAMTKVASLANSANMSFENTAAFLAQIVETTRESAETAGTALKTVIARFSEVKKLVSEGELTGQTEEGEEIDVNKVSTALRAANIDLNEYLTGAKGLDQIFMELSAKWDNLDIITQRYIATMAAGSRQQSRFIALMQDYSRMQELTGIATNANGAAQEQFEKTLESFETVINRLKNAWNSFLLGLANNEVIKGAINLFTGLINTLSKLIDTLSFGSSWVKTFLTAFLAIGGFSIGKQITNKMFAGLGAAMRGEGLKAGAAFNSGYKVTIKSFSAAHKLETQKAIVADNSLKTSRERLIKVSATVNRQGYSNISLRKLEAAASKEVTAQEELRRKAEADLIKAQHAYAQSLGVTESQLEVYDAVLKDSNSELVAAKVASTGLTYEQYKSIAATGAQNVATAKGVGVDKLSTAEKNKGTLAELQRTKMKNMGVLASIKEAIATTLSTNKTKEETVAAWADVKAKIAQKLASFGLAGAIIAAVAAVTILTVALIKSGESAAEFAKRMRASSDAAKAAAEKASQKYQELKDNFASLAEEKDTLNNLTYGTAEWAEQLDVVNNKILDILKVAPELAKYLTIDETGQLTLSEQGQNEFLKQQKENATQLQNAAIGTEMAALEAEARKLGYDLVGDDSQANQNIARVLAGDQDTIEKLLKEGVMTQEQLALAQSGSTKNIEKFIDQMGGHENANDISEYLAYGDALLKSDAYRKSYGTQLATNTLNNLDNVNESNQKAVSGYMLQLGTDLQGKYKEQYQEYETAKNTKLNTDIYENGHNTGRKYTQEDVDAAEKIKDQYLNMGRDLVRQLISAGYTDVKFDEDDFEITYTVEGEEDPVELKGDEILARMSSETQAKELEERGEKFALEYTKILNRLGDIEAIRAKSYEDRTQEEKDALANATILEKVFSKDYNNINEDEYSRILNDTNLQNMIMSLAEDEEGAILKNIAAEVVPHLKKVMDEALVTADQTVDSIRSEATKMGVDTVYLKEQEALLLAALKKKGKTDDAQLKKEVAQLVARNAKIKASAEELIASYDKWQKLIQKDGSIKVFNEEDRAVFNDYVVQFNKMFGITTKLDESFYKNAENVNLLTAALNNDKDAYEKLAKKVATEQLDIDVGFNGKEIQGEAKTALETVQSFITNFDLGSISTGDVIDNQGFINACKTLLETGAFTATQLQSIFSSLNLNFNAGMVKYTVKNGKAEFTEDELYKHYLSDVAYTTATVPAVSSAYNSKKTGFIATTDTATGGKKNTKAGATTVKVAGQDTAKNRAAFQDWMKKNAKVVSDSIEITAGEIPDFSGMKDNKGGSDKSNLNWSQLDEYINELRNVEALEQHISDIEAERSNLLSKHTGNAKQYTKLVKDQIGLLEQQRKEMEAMQAVRFQQLTELTDKLQNGADWKIEGTLDSGEEGLINVKDFAEYIKWDDKSGRVEVNWEPYNTSTDEIFKSNFDAVLSAMDEIASEYLEYQQKIWKTEEDQRKLLEESRSAYEELENKVVDMITWERQQEIDALTAINENINDVQSEIMDSIQKQIDLERQIRDNTKKEDEISDIENQIAFLSRDTSGANDVRIKELQKSLNDMTEEYQDTLIDQELQRITDSNEEAAKQREKQINILTESLEYDKEIGKLGQQAYELISAAYEGDKKLTPQDELWNRMVNYEQREGASETATDITMEEFSEAFEQALTYFEGVREPIENVEVALAGLATQAGLTTEQVNILQQALQSGLLPESWVQMIASDLGQLTSLVAELSAKTQGSFSQGIAGIFEVIEHLLVELEGSIGQIPTSFSDYFNQFDTIYNNWQEEDHNGLKFEEFFGNYDSIYQQWASEEHSTIDFKNYISGFSSIYDSWASQENSTETFENYINSFSQKYQEWANSEDSSDISKLGDYLGSYSEVYNQWAGNATNFDISQLGTLLNSYTNYYTEWASDEVNTDPNALETFLNTFHDDYTTWEGYGLTDSNFADFINSFNTDWTAWKDQNLTDGDFNTFITDFATHWQDWKDGNYSDEEFQTYLEAFPATATAWAANEETLAAYTQLTSFLNGFITTLITWNTKNGNDPTLGTYLSGISAQYTAWAQGDLSTSEFTTYLNQAPKQFAAWYTNHKDDKDMETYLNNLNDALQKAITPTTQYGEIMLPYVQKLDQAAKLAVQLSTANQSIQKYINNLDDCIKKLDFSDGAKKHLQDLCNQAILTLENPRGDRDKLAAQYAEATKTNSAYGIDFNTNFEDWKNSDNPLYREAYDLVGREATQQYLLQNRYNIGNIETMRLLKQMVNDSDLEDKDIGTLIHKYGDKNLKGADLVKQLWKRVYGTDFSWDTGSTSATNTTPTPATPEPAQVDTRPDLIKQYETVYSRKSPAYGTPGNTTKKKTGSVEDMVKWWFGDTYDTSSERQEIWGKLHPNQAYDYKQLRSDIGTIGAWYGYATGGLARSTGLAWLDGTPNRPEYVLNPAQTEAFLQLPDLLRSLDLTAGQNVSYGDTSIEINIQVDQLASDYDVEQLAEKIKTEIYDDSAYRNVNSIGWIR